MHELVCTDDRVHGTDVSAMRASNAKCFIDKRYRIIHISARGIRKCNKIAAEQVGYPLDRTFATRRALVDWRGFMYDCRGIGSASRVAALGTLRLRQKCVDFRYEFIVIRWQLP